MAEPDYACGICDIHFPWPPAHIIEDTPVCQECIDVEVVPNFRDALQFESKYPQKWGGTELLPIDFKEHFEDWDEFSEAWELKMAEYNMLSNERLYCRRCEKWLGKIPEPETTTSGTVHCSTCETNVCEKCGSNKHDGPNCDDDKAEDFKDDPACQKCPRCGRAYWLYEGCNHITCSACSQEWCWICGELSPANNHWEQGRDCPRFNAPGAPNAVFDRPAAEAQAWATRLTRELNHPPVHVADEIWDFEPPAAPRGIARDLGCLAWQKDWMNDFEDAGWEPSARAVEMAQALRGRYRPPGNIHLAPDWEVRGPEMCRDIVTADRDAIRQCMPEATTREEPPPLPGVDEDTMLDWRNLVLSTFSVYGILEEIQSSNHLLPHVTQMHVDIIELYPRVSGSRALRSRYGPIFAIVAKYLIAAPVRMMALLEARAQRRQQLGLPPNLDGPEHAEVRAVLRNLHDQEMHNLEQQAMQLNL